jgi:hypothetical protein
MATEMKKSKADPLKPPIEDLQGQVYQHELGDPDLAEQIDRRLEEWGRKASEKKRTRGPKRTVILSRRIQGKSSIAKTRKHLLIVIDASEVSERTVAYVAEMMEGREDVHVLLVHISEPVPPKLLEFGGSENPEEEQAGEAALQSARSDWIDREQTVVAPMFAHARTMLRGVGVPEQFVDTQIVASNPNESPGSAILEIAHERHCGTVVVGFAAVHPHLAEALLRNQAGIAVWIVH